jgi:hypothetical protein
LRLPDVVPSCVAFLGVEVGEGESASLRYGGTAFFVHVIAENDESQGFVYLVTARHNVERAVRDHNQLLMRVNARDEPSAIYAMPGAWDFHPEPGVDIAVLSGGPFASFDANSVPSHWLATHEIVNDFDIGYGDELYVTGLFSEFSGGERNMPIVRMGSIAAMPTEPLLNGDTGGEFDAYLAEMRSIGGLSGSPVFAWLGPNRMARTDGNKMLLLGLIHGHWDQKQPPIPFADSETAAVNMGIAIVTPAKYIHDILFSDAYVEERRRRVRDEPPVRPRGEPRTDVE